MAKLTAKTVETIKPTAIRQEIPDALLPGLYLIVQPSGARSWAVRYRHHGKPRKYTLGSYPIVDLKAARELGTKALRAAAEGRDPTNEKRQERATVLKDVVAQFLAKHGQRCRPRTLKEYERLLGRFVLVPWGNRPIGSITRAEVRAVLDKIIANGTPILANRAHGAIGTLFGWAAEQEIIAVSPVIGLKAPAVEKSRDRILSDDELRSVWRAAEQIGPPYGALLRLLILTGARRGEIAGLTWDEIDLKKQLIILPRDRVKNNRSHEIPLSPQAAAVIEALPRINERYLFSPLGSHPINGFARYKERFDRVCAVRGWTLHDLRRSAASGLARLGVNLPVIEKVLNHTSSSFAGVVGIYQRHDFAGEKRKALELWGAHVAAIVSDKPAKAKVVKLR
jgi:integrase